MKAPKGPTQLIARIIEDNLLRTEIGQESVAAKGFALKMPGLQGSFGGGHFYTKQGYPLGIA